jgi:hypothetical protein
MTVLVMNISCIQLFLLYIFSSDLSSHTFQSSIRVKDQILHPHKTGKNYSFVYFNLQVVRYKQGRGKILN